jgi:hypothetical protein
VHVSCFDEHSILLGQEVVIFFQSVLQPSAMNPAQVRKAKQEYQRLNKWCMNAFQSGQHREAADAYMKAVLTAPDKWVDIPGTPSSRFSNFRCYTAIIREKWTTPTDADWKTLRKKFLYCNEEPIAFRMEAALTLGLACWDTGDRETAADYYREGIALANEATAEERARSFLGAPDENMGAGPSLILTTIGSDIDESLVSLEGNLRILENPFGGYGSSRPNLRGDGSEMPEEVASNFILPDGSTDIASALSLMERQRVGGNKCDCCKKTREDLGMKTLLYCSGCSMASYCSKECQKKQWKAGHKQACRKKSQIEIGDVMKLSALQARPDLNDTLVTVVNPHPSKEGRWVVRGMNPPQEVVSVLAKNLLHIRPAM